MTIAAEVISSIFIGMFVLLNLPVLTLVKS